VTTQAICGLTAPSDAEIFRCSNEFVCSPVTAGPGAGRHPRPWSGLFAATDSCLLVRTPRVRATRLLGL